MSGSGTSAPDYERLLSDVQQAKRQQFPARELAPMLERLIKAAPPDARECLYAKLELAELTVGEKPFRAALLAREVLRSAEDDRAYGVLGLAHTLLGNYRAAVRAYRQAIAMAPRCPSYRHNLGHLLDVVFDRPRLALVHLEIAHRELSDEAEIASSYAHALLRAGQTARAREVLFEAVGDRAASVIESWCGAPRRAAD